MVIQVGWYQQRRIHVCLVHIDIINDVLILQCNNTEEPVAAELVKMGVPKDSIGLGFVPPEASQSAEYSARISSPLPRSEMRNAA